MNIPFISTLELGLIYSLVALGVYLSFRIINFADLTVDGSFPLGAAVVSILLTHDISPMVATFLAMIAGMIAGSVTAYLHIGLRIMGLLSGILTMTALYSINLRIMGNSPNIALINVNTLFSNNSFEILIVLGIVIVSFLSIMQLLMSQFGLALRVSGMNPKIAKSYGVNLNTATLFTLALSNGLVALAGALFAQSQGFADVSLGNGTIIIGLASVLIGEVFVTTNKIQFNLIACAIGAILYRFIIAFALNTQLISLQASDLNLITTIFVIASLMIPRFRKIAMGLIK